ncbi:hypothetical protein A4D02_22690 [Niastella koreensis]|uniref:Uncharacterized protein n=2 Tax=Niastella koreensis TaxID=354356 RepID=G8TED0_NIAKG|nr:hypothetical protein [Niastella koreensis]AEV98340.1 hypothetical protein Niako_1985 [Niastella koreensis GR20-10]OQP53205.1 hypothetical protein A4D02_22690 [Niastella koreensis]
MRTLFFIILCLITAHLFSQEKQFEQFIGWRGNSIEVHTVSDKAKQQCGILVANKDNIRVSWVNSHLQIVKQFTIARGYEELLLGGFIKEGKMYVYNQYPEVGEVHAWQLDSATGKVAEDRVVFKNADENTVSAVNCGEHFVYLTIKSNNAELIAHDFTNEHEFSTVSYHFDKDAWEKLVKTAHIKKGLQVGNIELEGECNIPLSACPNKIYCRNDTVLLLMNNELKETNVYCFDLKYKQASLRSVQHFAGFPYKSSADATDNSFLVQDKLLYVRVAKDSMGIQITNFYTGAEIASFKASAKDSLAFKNSSIVHKGAEGSEWFVVAGELYRKILGNYPLITAMPTKSNQLAITIGASSSAVSVARGRSYVPVPLVMPGMLPLHLLMLPVNSGMKKVVPETTLFTMLVDAGSGEPIHATSPATLYKKIDDLSFNLNKPLLGDALFTINGGYNYVYYDKKERKIMVYLL